MKKTLNKTKEALQLSELKNELWAKSTNIAVASDTSSPTSATSLCALMPPIESEAQLNTSLSVPFSETNTMINGSATEEDDGLIIMGEEGPPILQIEPTILLDDRHKFHINFDDVCLLTSLYRILQTYLHATPVEIRSSYIHIVWQVHQDKNLNDPRCLQRYSPGK